MCGAVVDVAAMVVALPPPAAAGAAGSGLPQHSAPGQQAAEQQQQQQLLLPYPASLRHNDCHFIYQAGGCRCMLLSSLLGAPLSAMPSHSHDMSHIVHAPDPLHPACSPACRRCAICPTSLLPACSSWCTATSISSILPPECGGRARSALWPWWVGGRPVCAPLLLPPGFGAATDKQLALTLGFETACLGSG